MNPKKRLKEELEKAIFRGDKRLEHLLRKILIQTYEMPVEEIQKIIQKANTHWEEVRTSLLAHLKRNR